MHVMHMLSQRRRVVDSTGNKGDAQQTLCQSISTTGRLQDVHNPTPALDIMQLTTHAKLLAALFWCRETYAALYTDAALLPSTAFDFVIVGGPLSQ